MKLYKCYPLAIRSEFDTFQIGLGTSKPRVHVAIYGVQLHNGSAKLGMFVEAGVIVLDVYRGLSQHRFLVSG